MTLTPAVDIRVQPGADAASARDELRRVDPLQDPSWDRLVSAYPEASFFQSTPWFRTLAAAYNHRPHGLVWQRRFVPDAIVPVMEVASPLTGRRGVSMPFSDFSEPLLDAAADPEALRAALLQYGREQGWKYLEVRGGQRLFPNVQPFTRFHVHTLALSRTADELWTGCKDSVQRAVRKAEAAGVTVAVDNSSAAVREFHRLQCVTRRKHGLPAQPISFFEALRENVLAPGHGALFLAKKDGIVLGGAVFVHFGRKAIFKYGASDTRMLHLRPNNLLMWRAIQRYAADGFHDLNFGRTELDNQGLRRYKLAFGVEEQLFNYFRYDYRRADFIIAGASPAPRLVHQLVRMMPLPLVRWLGVLLYRHAA